MRILHISDFHLDKSTSIDSQRQILDPLLKTILKIHEQQPIDLVFFTGDAVNMGGVSYGGVKNALSEFKSIFVDPLLGKIRLEGDRFFFVPGNHDIDRGADSVILEKGIEDTLITTEKVNEFLTNPEGIQRIAPFKDFEKEYYKNINHIEKSLSQFQSTFKFEINGNMIGIACLNSVWRSYDRKIEDGDKGKLWLGEKQLLDAVDNLKDCTIKIALCHNQVDWLNQIDSKVATKILRTHFNLFFSGHVHNPNADFSSAPDGQLFSFCSAGTLSANIRKIDPEYYNGFTIVDYDLESEQMDAQFKCQNYLGQEFINNPKIGNEGKWGAKIPVGEEVHALNQVHELIGNILEDSCSQNNTHLLSFASDSKAPKSINEMFVMPNLIVKDEYESIKDNKTITSIDELIKTKNNYVIFGTKESGKTILLDKILLETIAKFKEHHILPALVEFKDIKSEILTNIRTFWSKSNKETKSSLESNNVLLLIDNLSFESEHIKTLNVIRTFLEEYPNVIFIATSNQLFEHQIPLNPDTVGLLEYQRLTIGQFKSKQIKELINKWFSLSTLNDTPLKLEALSIAFMALNLPRTPFAISMYLWIIEKQEHYRPINNAVLIENYIERLLNKHGVHEGSRGRFDYNNKLWLLAAIAKEMLDQDADNYALAMPDFKQFIIKYLEGKKFDPIAEKLIDEFFLRGIFIEHESSVRFRFVCFFEFFLATKMRYDTKFKEFVLSEENYLKFVNEIDYYTGLQRGETELLKLLMVRLEDGFSQLKSTILNAGLSADEYFTPKRTILEQLSETEIADIIAKPTEEELEMIEDKKLELRKPQNAIARKSISDDYTRLSRLLVLSLRAIRNSEEVEEDNLKMDSYSQAIKCSIAFTVLTKLIIIFVSEHITNISQEKKNDLALVAKYLPIVQQTTISENIGTQKLSVVIHQKIIDDKHNVDISDYEKFLSVFLYADARGADYEKVISDYIRSSPKKYIKDSIFIKLIRYYFHRSKTTASDNFYLNNIADLLIATDGVNKRSKSTVMESLRKNKRKNLSEFNDR